MSAYPLVALGDVAHIERKSVAPQDLTPDTIYLGLEHIERGGRILRYETVGEAALTSSKFIFEPSHVLFGKLRPNLGKVSRPEFGGVCSTDILPIRPGPNLDRDYLAHYLSTPTMIEFAASRTTGANLPRLNPRTLANFPIPLPPLAEQRRIAAILDKATAIHQKRQQALDYLDTLSQSIFHEMFDGFIANATVGEVMSIQGGLQVSARRNSLPIEIPYLRVANAFRGYLDLREIKTMRASEAEIDRTRLANGDLLFVEGHANILEVGRVSMWSTEIENCVHQNHLIRGRVDNHRILPIFAMYWLNSNAGASHFRRTGKTTSGLNTINVTTVRSAPIPLPPINLQHRFAERISSITKQRSSLKSILAAGSELFASLQARAFRGEL